MKIHELFYEVRRISPLRHRVSVALEDDHVPSMGHAEYIAELAAEHFNNAEPKWVWPIEFTLFDERGVEFARVNVHRNVVYQFVADDPEESPSFADPTPGRKKGSESES